MNKISTLSHGGLSSAVGGRFIERGRHGKSGSSRKILEYSGQPTNKISIPGGCGQSSVVRGP